MLAGSLEKLDCLRRTMSSPIDGATRRAIGWYIGISFGIGYLFQSVLWVDPRHLDSPWVLPTLCATMFAPAIATFIVTRWIERPPSIREFTGLRLGKGRKWGWYWLFAWLGIPALWTATALIGWALNLLPADPVHSPGFSKLSEQSSFLAQLTAGNPHLGPIAVGLVAAIINPLAGGILFTFGEEWGWRGFLTPALLPLGQWRAFLLTGIIWGVWHAPMIALGFNYPPHTVLGPFLMIVICVLLAVIFGWLRIATGSVWPAVIAHATNNAFNGMFTLVGPLEAFDTALIGALSWVAPFAFIGLLLATGKLPVLDPR